MFVDFSLQGGLQHLPRPLAHDDFQRTHRLGRCFDSSLGGILAHGRSPLGEFCLATKPYREETSVFYSVHKNRSYLSMRRSYLDDVRIIPIIDIAGQSNATRIEYG